MSREHWEKNALDWAGWAATPGFDSYWSYSPEFFKLVPAPRLQGAPDVDVEKNPGHARWSRIPLFLMWRAIKTG
jgi:hypothetical protein